MEKTVWLVDLGSLQYSNLLVQQLQKEVMLLAERKKVFLVPLCISGSLQWNTFESGIKRKNKTIFYISLNWAIIIEKLDKKAYHVHVFLRKKEKKTMFIL